MSLPNLNVAEEKWICFIISLFAWIVIYLLHVSHGEFIRHGRYFHMSLSKVHSHKRIKATFVLENYTSLDIFGCVEKCLENTICVSVNHHEEHQLCQLLNTTTVATEQRLVSQIGWAHYESKTDEKNNGPFCEENTPCPGTHICYDTYRSPSYVCRCQKDFKGPTCQEFTGPGSNQNFPAGSCSLLFQKYKQLKNGDYWISQSNERKSVLTKCSFRSSNKEEATKLILQRRNVCYGTQTGSFGSFNIRKSGQLNSLKLVHKSGEIYCSKKSLKSFWGCVNQGDDCKTANCISTFVTNAQNDILFPKPSNKLESNSSFSYNDPNVVHDGNFMFMRQKDYSVAVTKFEELKVWFGMTLKRVVNYGQYGKHCVDIYASFN